MNLWDLIMIKVRAAFNTHKADANAHHARYTDAEAITAMGTKSDTNSLNHDRPILHACRVYAGKEQLIPNSTFTWADFVVGSEAAHVVYNYGNMYDLTQHDRILINRNGIYIITYIGIWHGSSDGIYRTMDIYKNGGVIVTTVRNSYLPQNQALYQTAVAVIAANEGDYIQIKLFQDSGGSLNWYANNSGVGISVTMLREI